LFYRENWRIKRVEHYFAEIIPMITIFLHFRSSDFKEDDAIWKGGEDGGGGGGGPPPAGMGAAGPTGGYVAK
jgi:hypothetical protein